MNNELLKVGQRVRTELYSRGLGTIIAIHGPQNPSGVRSLGNGCVMTGGSAYFDIAFDCGSVTRQLPECILRGGGWDILPDVVDADSILDSLAFCRETEAKAQQEKRDKDARRAAERVKHAADNPHLTREGSTEAKGANGGKLVAMNVRKELKRHFPGTKFSVTSDYSSVDVRWTDGPAYDQVDAIAGRHQLGRFDGMTDCYEFDHDRTFSSVFGGCKYVMCHRATTIEGVTEAIRRADRDDLDPTGFEQGNAKRQGEIRRVWGDCDLQGWKPGKPAAAPPPAPAPQPVEVATIEDVEVLDISWL